MSLLIKLLAAILTWVDRAPSATADEPVVDRPSMTGRLGRRTVAIAQARDSNAMGCLLVVAIPPLLVLSVAAGGLVANGIRLVWPAITDAGFIDAVIAAAITLLVLALSAVIRNARTSRWVDPMTVLVGSLSLDLVILAWVVLSRPRA